MPQPESPSTKNLSKRRSQRLLLRVPVQARRKVKGADVPPDDTETLAVNAHGALVLLIPPAEEGEHLLLQNLMTKEEQICRVVYLGQTEGRRLQVGVEFISPAPHFWPVVFPPEDWSSVGKDIKQAPKI